VTHKKPKQTSTGAGVTLEAVCTYYVDRATRENRSTTVEKRADTLFDLCYGFSPKWRETESRKPGLPPAKERIHPGYGKLTIEELRPHHLEDWLDAHPGWKTAAGRKTRLQAVKRALNRAAKGGLIPKDHGIRGMSVPAGRARATYISPEQEKVLLSFCNPPLKTALQVLIRTGMRPGCELAKVTAAHFVDHGDRIEIVFSPDEAKTNRERVIFLKESWLVELFRKQAKQHPSGPLFRNKLGGPWHEKTLYRGFTRALKKAKQTIEFDSDVCLYSTRHTYAKRALTGYWTGRPINMDLLATLMGNTPQVCAKHYAKLLLNLDGMKALAWAAC
jgi:integrase